MTANIVTELSGATPHMRGSDILDGADPSEVCFRDPGEPPVLDWVSVDLIDIDPDYQRGLDEARVGKILDWFSWKSFGAIVIAPKADGRFNAIDGQHRLEAAKRHPMITVVPAVIIAEAGTQPEAETFVTINANRRNVSPLDLYHAELAAADPDAQTVSQVAGRAGVVILRHQPGRAYRESETIAIGVIRSLVNRHGAMKSRQMLEVLGKAHLKPISGNQIRAVEILFTDPEFRDQVEPEAMTEAIYGHALVIEDQAKAFSFTHRTTLAKAMASIWFKRCRKKRKAAA